MYQSDTIAAIATASTGGGISVIRISGEKSVEIVDKIYQSKNNQKRLINQKSHTLHYGYIYDEESCIDEVIVLLMLSPNSYTTENVVEIDCHGGPTVSKMILETLIKNGVRLAEPGEFTKRAFLNGRIDLSQAEAVIDVIQAKNKFALESSVSQLRGNIKEKIAEIRKEILHDVAFIEAALDDPEHIELDGFSDELYGRVKKILLKSNHILDNCENGRIIKEGVKTVILGKPNVGKSSFMNTMLRQERAIVTSIPGTTRDTLEEEIQIGNVTLCMIDTAGIRETKDEIERIGIERAKKLLENADFIISIFDCSVPFDDNDKDILNLMQNKKAVVLLNKSDLSPVIKKSELEKLSGQKVIEFSAVDQRGLIELESYIQDLFYNESLSYNNEIYITSMRQKEALMEGIVSLEQLIGSIEMEMSEDFFSIDLTNAYEAFGRIIGETVEDDIIDTIFRQFCMGK